MTEPAARTATAHLHVADAAKLLVPAASPRWHSLVTGLPDAAETTMDIRTWESWFVDMVMMCTMSINREGVAVFAQTDRLHDKRMTSKAELVFRGIRAAGAHPLWHKIAINSLGISLWRPAYTHLIAATYRSRPGKRTADVVSAGPKHYPNALGRDAIDLIYESIAHVPAPVIGDPFCGRGSLLLGAVQSGRDVVGGDIDPAQVQAAAQTLAVFADVRLEDDGS